MTIQQAKQELQDCKHDIAEIKNRWDEIRGVENRVHIGSGGDTENSVVALIELKDYYSQLVEQLVQKRLNIEEKISRIPQPHRNILHMHYLRGIPLVEVATRLHYDYTYTSKLHTKALWMYAEFG